MNNKTFLKYCLVEVENKLGWEKSEFWKDKDYTKLSNVIFEASNITISPHTLKRLFGKIKYAKSYNPQQATKDALTKYVGYENWDDFIKKYQCEKEYESEIVHKIDTKTLLKKSIVPMLILLVVFIAVFSIQRSDEAIDFSFDLNDSIGVVPHTVFVKYDVSKIKTDSVFIDYSFINPNRGPRITRLDKFKFVNNFTYQIPGYYPVNLIIDNDIVSTQKVLVMSNNWDSYIMPENDSQRFWIDNKINNETENGYLYFSQDTIKNKGFHHPVFYVAHRLFKNFEINGDNFELEVKFKNTEALGGITCYNFNFKVYCKNETNYFSLMEDGCSIFSKLKIGERELNGVDTDLSAFKINIEDWNLFRVKVEEKKASVYINGDLIFDDSYMVSNGKIVGLENSFKGSGMLDYIKLKDLKTGHVFFDDF